MLINVNKSMRILLPIILIFSSISLVFAQSAHELKQDGDDCYTAQNYTEAEENYRKSIEVEPTVNGEYNLGNSIYMQERFEEAISHYENAVRLAKDKETKADAFYNLGNSYLNAGKLEEGINSYINTLKINPKDDDAKHNLTLAKRMLQQQQEQEQKECNNPKEGEEGEEEKDQQKKQDKPENQEDQEKKEQEDKKEGEENEEEKDPEDQEGNENKEGEEEEPKPGEEKTDLSKEEATRLLQAVEEDERKTQEKLIKAKSKNVKPSKDW